MRNFLSIALTAVFSVSSLTALTCGIECDHTSQSSANHSASAHSLHAEHGSHHTGEPLVGAGEHFCGTHADGEAVFSPKRAVQMDERIALAEIPSASYVGRLANLVARLDIPWQLSFPHARPSRSLRV
jgi:hypothetical protein